MSGSWTGDGPDFITNLDLKDSLVGTGKGIVSGRGSFTGPGIAGGGGAFAVDGKDSSPMVLLAFFAPGHQTAWFTGQIVADTEMDGVLDSSGFNHLALTFKHHPLVASIHLMPQTDSALPSHTIQFTDSAFDILGRLLVSQPITWSTSDSTVAKVSANGLLTAIGPGLVTVSASNNGVVAQAQVTVLKPVVSVIIVPQTMTLVVPTTVGLQATLLDNAGSVITGRAITWSSTNSAVAGILGSDSAGARATGTADIKGTVTLDGRSGTAHVVVRTLQVTQIAAGTDHSCAVDADGTVACWGDGLVGQLGAGTRTIVAAPLFVIGGLRFRTVQGGDVHNCGLAVDSTAYCWGGNGIGQLGNGTDTTDTVPVAVAGGLKFVALTVGRNHTCALTPSGAAYCWGSNGAGELGTGTTQSADPIPGPVSGGVSFTMLAAGAAHTCGLASDSAAYCWGGNDVGTLGDSTTTSRTVPTAVAGGHKFASIAAGAYHTCGITGAGVAYCWGNNISSELGDSSGNVQQIVPVAVHASGAIFTAIAAGFNHTCARSGSGAIYCWGDNTTGQIGPNGGSSAAVPVAVGVTGSAIVAGGWHSCALTASGAYCWGYNQLGQLGSGSAGGQSATPLKVSGQP